MQNEIEQYALKARSLLEEISEYKHRGSIHPPLMPVFVRIASFLNDPIPNSVQKCSSELCGKDADYFVPIVNADSLYFCQGHGAKCVDMMFSQGFRLEMKEVKSC